MSEYHHYNMADLRQLVAGRTQFQQEEPTHEQPFFLYNYNRSLSAPQTHFHHYHHPNHRSFESNIIINGHHHHLHHHDQHYHGLMLHNPTGLVKLGQTCTNATTGNNIPSSSATSTASAAAIADATPFFKGVELEGGVWIGNDGGNSNNNSRWPRQETLTLLEIRSRLDSKFKEANQKGPLWDEVSRIMSEEHGYQRNGKKCREKFENLYKYYKKTKEGKAGRQDGRHYRFFRQLEALCGGGETSNSNQALANTALLHYYDVNSNNNAMVSQENCTNHRQEAIQESSNKHHSDQSLSFSNTNTSEFETASSSENNNEDDLSAIACMMNKVRKQKGSMMIDESQSCRRKKAANDEKKKRWKAKVKDFVDLEMRKLMDAQEVWMERMLKTIEDREHERMCREEEWMRQEQARFDLEHEYWAKERAAIEARDASLIEALKNCSGKELQVLSSPVKQIVAATQSHHYKNNTNY